MYWELQEIPLFEKFKQNDLKYIYQFISRHKYKRNEYIIRQGNGNSYFYIIKSGQIKICTMSQQGIDIVLALLQDGEYFGEMSLIDRSECCASAICMQPCVLYSIRQDKFQKLLREYHIMLMLLLKKNIERLRYNNFQMNNLKCRNSVRRVAVILNCLAEENGYRSRKSVVIEKIPFEKDIASMAGTSRETVSRTLSLLQEQKYITKNCRRIVILDYQRFYVDFCL